MSYRSIRSDQPKPPAHLNIFRRLNPKFGHPDFAEGFKKGNTDAFEQVYRKFQRPLRAFVAQKISDPLVVEELAQEVFLKSFRFRESYDSRFEFSTWLWTIARNTMTDWFRKDGNISPPKEVGETDSADSDGIPCPRLNPEASLLARNDQAWLLERVGALTELQKRVLFMRIIRQLSYREIARQLNLSISAAKCLVHRAKKTLVKNLPAGETFTFATAKLF